MAARAERQHIASTGPCSVDGCESEATYPGLKLCGACYQGIRANQLRSTKDLMRYAKKVRRIAKRVELITGTARRAKVVVAFKRER